MTSPAYLALDTGSAQVSVAAGRRGEEPVWRALAQERSSAELLAAIDAVLKELGVEPRALAGIVALAGPGSFTGLRVGLATALGLSQALGIKAAGIPTLQALALAAGVEQGVVAGAVDALRGEWFVQRFEVAVSNTVPRALEEPALRPTADLAGLGAAAVIGFSVTKALGEAASGLRGIEPPPLAPAALRIAWHLDEWDAGTLTRPLYLRAPAVSLPAKKP